MIARLAGRLDESGIDWAVIDVHGVGYLVHCSARTLAHLGQPGATVVVHTELVISENDQRLIGFASAGERSWFRLLVQVQGVGSKVALAILSALTVDECHRAIATGHAATIATANGVGPKLASRIINELKDRVGSLSGPMVGATGAAPTASSGHAIGSDAAADAISALQNLGFKPAVAAAAVGKAQAELGPDAPLNSLVPLALKLAST